MVLKGYHKNGTQTATYEVSRGTKNISVFLKTESMKILRVVKH